MDIAGSQDSVVVLLTYHTHRNLWLAADIAVLVTSIWHTGSARPVTADRACRVDCLIGYRQHWGLGDKVTDWHSSMLIVERSHTLERCIVNTTDHTAQEAHYRRQACLVVTGWHRHRSPYHNSPVEMRPVQGIGPAEPGSGSLLGYHCFDSFHTVGNGWDRRTVAAQNSLVVKKEQEHLKGMIGCLLVKMAETAAVVALKQ